MHTQLKSKSNYKKVHDNSKKKILNCEKIFKNKQLNLNTGDLYGAWKKKKNRRHDLI